MIGIGFALSSEEHGPRDLVALARRAEERGFGHAFISDHFHPWTDRQGQAPFVWSVLGAIAQATTGMRVATGVTCPIIRTHPAVVAQAAATTAALMPGRFALGLGSGENLNEHVVGAGWPAPDVRLDMLEEAILVIRRLWSGEMVTVRGRYFQVDHARLYTLPARPPPVVVAAGAPGAADLAGREGDALVSTSPSAETVQHFRSAGGTGPAFGQLTVCWAPSEDEAVRTAMEWWPNAAVPGDLTKELPLPGHFMQAARLVRPDDITPSIPCGPDPERHADGIRQFAGAGYSHVYVHQVGPDQDGFMRVNAREVMPRITGERAAA